MLLLFKTFMSVCACLRLGVSHVLPYPPIPRALQSPQRPRRSFTCMGGSAGSGLTYGRSGLWGQPLVRIVLFPALLHVVTLTVCCTAGWDAWAFTKWNCTGKRNWSPGTRSAAPEREISQRLVETPHSTDTNLINRRAASCQKELSNEKWQKAKQQYWVFLMQRETTQQIHSL